MPTLRKTPSILASESEPGSGGRSWDPAAPCRSGAPGLPCRRIDEADGQGAPNEGRHHRSESRNRFGVCPAATAAGRLCGGGGEVSAAGERAAPPSGGFSADLANLQLRRRRGGKRSSVRRLTELRAGGSVDQQRRNRRGAG